MSAVDRKIALSYIAGVIDSDGSFSIIKTNANSPSRLKYSKVRTKFFYNPWIQIAQIDSEAITLIKEIFPNHNVYHQPMKKNKKNSFYRIIFTGQKAYGIAKELLPYLYIKKEQAQIILDYETLSKQKPTEKRKVEIKRYNKKFRKTTYRLSKYQIQQRELLVERIRKANGTL